MKRIFQRWLRESHWTDFFLTSQAYCKHLFIVGTRIVLISSFFIFFRIQKHKEAAYQYVLLDYASFTPIILKLLPSYRKMVDSSLQSVRQRSLDKKLKKRCHIVVVLYNCVFCTRNNFDIVDAIS